MTIALSQLDHFESPIALLSAVLTVLVVLGLIVLSGGLLRGESRVLDSWARWRWRRTVSEYRPGQDDLDASEQRRLQMEEHRRCGCRVCRHILEEAGNDPDSGTPGTQ